MAASEEGTASRDSFLSGLVRGADRIDPSDRIGGSDVAIVVGGTLITGKLTGEAQYFSMIAEGFTKGSRGDPDLATAPQYFIDRSRAAAADADEGAYEPSFLHLREVQIVGGPGLINTKDFMLRIRLSDVQGFGLGKIASTR